MVMNARQQIATAFFAVLIVASVLSMPRAAPDALRDNRPARSAGMVASAPARAPAPEAANDQIKDLTYN